MIQNDSLEELVETLRKRSPECVNLLTAKTQEEFEEAFIPFLAEAISHLEKNSKNFQDLGEVGLTAVLVAKLSFPGFAVTQEGYSNGHVDLIAEVDHSIDLKKLGEAKVYDGAEYHIAGMGQLLGRYATGREGKGFLVSYVRKKNIKEITERLRAVLDEKRPEKQTGPCEDHQLKWSLSTNHEHHSGEIVSLDHIGCNLYFG